MSFGFRNQRRNESAGAALTTGKTRHIECRPECYRLVVPEFAQHLPVERILFGSDWPHAEGIGHSRDFFEKVETFSLEDQRRIMVENARELMS